MRLPSYIKDLASRHGKLAAIAFSLLAAFMPIAPRLLPLCLVAGVVGLVVHHRAWERRPHLSGIWRTALPWLLLLYLLHIIGVGWSTNLDYASFDLQVKLPLALLPLVFLWIPDPNGLRALFRPFIWGSVAAVVILLLTLVWRLLFMPGIDVANEVFGERFSWMVHPSYFALYLCIAVGGLLLEPFGTHRQRLVFLTLLCLGLLLCGSKSGWISSGIVLLFILVARWKDTQLRRLLLGLSALSLIGLVALASLSSNVRERMSEAWQALVGRETNAEASTSSAIRKLAWDSAADVAREHAPWGTGTGDVKDELMVAHERSGYVYLLEKRINAHSEYLQLWAALGWLGLVLTVLMVAVPLLSALRARDALASIFFLISGASWIVESMLEVQAGVLFFAFFSCLLMQRGATAVASSAETTTHA